MKKIVIITPVPEVIKVLIENSIIRKSIDNHVASIEVINLRDFGIGNYKQIDDSPYGGGSGMVMMAEPLMDATEKALDLIGRSSDVEIIYPSPQGKLWNQDLAKKISQTEKMIFICGHYKGIDQRVIDKYVTNQFSVGDYVLTNGELPSMIMLDSALRLVPGVLNNIESALSDTFSLGLLDYPHYTQPRIIDDKEVPEVLVSGHHEKIESWRQGHRESRTREKRPDLWEKYKKIRKSE